MHEWGITKSECLYGCSGALTNDNFYHLWQKVRFRMMCTWLICPAPYSQLYYIGAYLYNIYKSKIWHFYISERLLKPQYSPTLHHFLTLISHYPLLNRKRRGRQASPRYKLHHESSVYWLLLIILLAMLQTYVKCSIREVNEVVTKYIAKCKLTKLL